MLRRKKTTGFSAASADSGRGRGFEEAHRDERKRIAVRVGIVLMLVAAVVLCMKLLERRVMGGRGPAAVRSVRVRLAKRPAWMPAALAERITASLDLSQTNFQTPALATEAYRRAMANPWVRKVHRVVKRRTDDPQVGIVELHAEFRKPVARVAVGTNYVYVDAEGFVLPADQVPQWVVTIPASGDSPGRQLCYLRREDVPRGAPVTGIHYILIDGVVEPHPPVGQRWEGEDLIEGLKLVRLISARPYANQITVVDVRNHAGRISRNEPHLRMYAQVHRGQPTDIRFGRFPAPVAGDYVVSPERKLSYLDDYVADHGGQLAGLNSYIDLRYDELHLSIN